MYNEADRASDKRPRPRRRGRGPLLVSLERRASHGQTREQEVPGKRAHALSIRSLALTHSPPLCALQSSKPPSSSSSSSGPRADTRTPARSNHDGGADGDDEDEDSAAFLAKDLALQRLISESHILAAAGGNAAYYTSATSGGAAASAPAEKLFSGGRVRRLTTDLRLQALGAKGSVLKQAKMPMNVRKGLEAAAAERENKRRREARENGVVLERRGGGGSAIVGAGGVGGAAARGKGKGKRRGSRPVDLPAVGKLRGAELRISARDIRSVENLGRSPAGKGRHKRRR